MFYADKCLIASQVSLLRMSQFGAILISATQEYHNKENGTGISQMNLQFPFYVANVPNTAVYSVLQVSSIYAPPQFLSVAVIISLLFYQSCKNPTNLQTWFGGRFWPKKRGMFCVSVLRYPSAGKVGINL